MRRKVISKFRDRNKFLRAIHVSANDAGIPQGVNFEIGSLAIRSPCEEMTVRVGNWLDNKTRFRVCTARSVKIKNRLPIGAIQLNNHIFPNWRGEDIKQPTIRRD